MIAPAQAKVAPTSQGPVASQDAPALRLGIMLIRIDSMREELFELRYDTGGNRRIP